MSQPPPWREQLCITQQPPPHIQHCAPLQLVRVHTHIHQPLPIPERLVVRLDFRDPQRPNDRCDITYDEEAVILDAGFGPHIELPHPDQEVVKIIVRNDVETAVECKVVLFRDPVNGFELDKEPLACTHAADMIFSCA